MSVKPKIAVVGDIMVDIDVHCSATRLSQDGPWPVLVVNKHVTRMGGAGNVQEMLHALGADTLLCGVVGQFDTIPARGSSRGWVRAPGRSTTKTRFWVDGRLTGPRVDVDNHYQVTDVSRWRETLLEWGPDAIVVADHGKGVITADVMGMLGSLGVPLFVDPINTTNLADATIEAIAYGPHERPSRLTNAVLVHIVKFGEKGLSWGMPGRRAISVPSMCRTLVDALGAGDQFIAALTYQRCMGVDWPQAIEWANTAAGIQCERAGCIPVTAPEIEVRRDHATV